MKQFITVNGIIEKNGKVLLARRSANKRIAPGKYHLPGGHVEFGEEPTEALIREFHEEFGINVTVKAIVNAFSYTHNDDHAVGIAYSLETNSKLSDIQPITDDNDEVVWAAQGEIDSYLDSTDHNYTILEQYFAARK